MKKTEVRMDPMQMIIYFKQMLRELGQIPRSIEPWELDDNGLMYANSLLEQLEEIQDDKNVQG